MADERTPDEQPEDEPVQPAAEESSAGGALTLDQAALDALLASGELADDEEEAGDAEPPAAEAAAPAAGVDQGVLDQATIDALLGGGGAADDEDIAVDQAAIDALLNAADDVSEPVTKGPTGGLLDQNSLDALWAQAEAEAEAERKVSSVPAAAPPAAPKAKPRGAEPAQAKVSQNTVGDLDLLADVILTVSAEIGRTDITIEEILKLAPGYLIELDKVAGEPVELFVNDRCIARGEVVVVEDNFAVRITDLGH